MMKVEYRVRPITRYIVTRWHEETDDQGRHLGGSDTRGEYDNAEVAYEVAYALCKAEHDASGQPLDSMSFIYPEPIVPPVVSDHQQAQDAMRRYNEFCAQVSAKMTI